MISNSQDYQPGYGGTFWMPQTNYKWLRFLLLTVEVTWQSLKGAGAPATASPVCPGVLSNVALFYMG